MSQRCSLRVFAPPRARLLVAASVALLAGACRLHDVEPAPRPLVPAPESYPAWVEAEDARSAPAPRGPEQSSESAWWSDFHDARLAALIEAALAGNLDVHQALARVTAARAAARRAGAPQEPQLDLVAGRSSRSRADHVHDLDENRQRTREGGLAFAWELDLFGRHGSARDAALEDAAAAVDDLHAARLLLSAEVADAYLEALEQTLTLRLLDEQVDVASTLLELTELRFAQGGASAVDVLQQRGQIAATRALVPAVQARRRLAENRLDVLLGAAPDGLDRVDGADYPRPAAPPDVGVPADLLVRRPDLRGLMRRLVAQDHRVAQVLAERLPRLLLGGSLLRRDDDVDVGFLLDLAASLVQPLFDGGARAAVVEEQRAEYERLALAFSAAFLTAVEEVDGALYRERRQQEEVVLLRERLAVLDANVREARLRYAHGLTDYLPVLLAVDGVHATQRQLLVSERDLLARRVALHRALGGAVRGGLDDDALQGEQASLLAAGDVPREGGS